MDERSVESESVKRMCWPFDKFRFALRRLRRSCDAVLAFSSLEGASPQFELAAANPHSSANLSDSWEPRGLGHSESSKWDSRSIKS